MVTYISVKDSKYSIEGIYCGMDQTEAEMRLADSGYYDIDYEMQKKDKLGPRSVKGGKITVMPEYANGKVVGITAALK